MLFSVAFDNFSRFGLGGRVKIVDFAPNEGVEIFTGDEDDVTRRAEFFTSFFWGKFLPTNFAGCMREDEGVALKVGRRLWDLPHQSQFGHSEPQQAYGMKYDSYATTEKNSRWNEMKEDDREPCGLTRCKLPKTNIF